MTQINTIHENAVIQTRQRQSAPSAEGFQGSLDVALAQNTVCKTEGEPTTALSEPQTSRINQVVAPSETEVVCQTDNLLGLLESYANGLGNPKTTIKDLASLVDRIKDGADQLMISADKGTAAGSDLGKIAARTALMAATEYVKFQRGDYL